MKNISPVKAIRKHCLECSGGSYSEVQNCIIKDCPLYLYRLGKNPNYESKKGNPQPQEDSTKTIENSKEF